MPPRLPTTSALRAPAECLLPRFFSSTAAVSSPPAPTPAQRSPRSTTSAHPRAAPSSNSSIVDMVNRTSRTKPERSIKPGEAASRVMSHLKRRVQNTARDAMTALEDQRNQKLARDYLKQMPRPWVPGDVYSPRDMSPHQMNKWRLRPQRKGDVVDVLGIKPLDMYTNFTLLSEFTTGSGMIKHASETKLRPVNQRKIAKMVRRAQGMGIYPTIHRHPEMLREIFLQNIKSKVNMQ